MVKNKLKTNYISSPGETIKDILEENSLTTIEFSKKINKSLEFTERLLKGLEPIDEDLAKILANDLGWSSKEFWIRREEFFRKVKEIFKK